MSHPETFLGASGSINHHIYALTDNVTDDQFEQALDPAIPVQSTRSRAMSTALVLADSGKRANGKWAYGAVANVEDSPRSVWIKHMSQAGVVLDHAPDLAEAVVAGTLALDAAHRQAERPSGFPEGDGYFQAHPSGSPPAGDRNPLPRIGHAADIRRELVGLLSAQGMSTRAIAPTVGVSNKTISLDRQVLPQVTPAAGTERTGSTIATTEGVVIAQAEHIDLTTGEVLDSASVATVAMTATVARQGGSCGRDTYDCREPRPCCWHQQEGHPQLN